MQNKTIDPQHLSLFPEGTKIKIIAPEEAIDFIEKKTKIAKVYRELISRSKYKDWTFNIDLSQDISIFRKNILFINEDLHINGSVNFEPLWDTYGGLIVKGNLLVENTLYTGFSTNQNLNHTIIVVNNLSVNNLICRGNMFVGGNVSVGYFIEGLELRNRLVIRGKFVSKYHHYDGWGGYPICNNPDGTHLTVVMTYNSKGWAFVEEVLYIPGGTLIYDSLYEYLSEGKNIFNGNPDDYCKIQTFENGCVKPLL